MPSAKIHHLSKSQLVTQEDVKNRNLYAWKAVLVGTDGYIDTTNRQNLLIHCCSCGAYNAVEYRNEHVAECADCGESEFEVMEKAERKESCAFSCKKLVSEGDNYYYGNCGCVVDYEKALTYYREAADCQYHWGYFNVGKCYHEGKGVAKNKERAKEWYRIAANMGNFWASMKLAELGVADQMNHVGDCYYHGTAERQGDEDFRAEAYHWYMKAAEQGYEWGYFNVGKCYREGIGVEQDLENAKEWYRKAANMGNFWASLKLAELGVADQMNHVGDCYYHDTAERQGDEDFRAEAYHWYMKAAEQGYEWGYFNVGKCYREGIGVEQDLETAKEWYRKAANMRNFWASLKLAELGVADQMNQVGDCYYHDTAERQGDEDFRAEAYRWYMKAAEQGYEWGYYNVGKCYEEGIGVELNIEKAKEWYRKAAKHDNFWALKKLSELD